jgi:hypothetical protein
MSSTVPYPYPLPKEYIDTAVQVPVVIKPVTVAAVPTTVTVTKTVTVLQVPPELFKAVVLELCRLLKFYRTHDMSILAIKNSEDLDDLIKRIRHLTDTLLSKPAVPINPLTGKPISRQAMAKRRKASSMIQARPLTTFQLMREERYGNKSEAVVGSGEISG